MNSNKTKGNQFRYISEINITSLADVAINLMIIFLIAGISVALSRTEISVTLPKSSAATIQKGEGLTITITKEKKILIENKTVSLEKFSQELAQIQNEKPFSRAYLLADVNIDYGTIIKVITEVRNQGIEQIGLVVTPEAIQKKK
ncbi:MAG: biopolymer transporter ExbD [candidate division WOR-3 bacterium]|nr:biopolymer transporter ExbD [candidate division WOR-3 bacterium]MCX7757474.1 biopolymer transporter ExbD [candidate division WOR-3 bacterium]MDW7987147.1 biopolymer transporter ExbD [candidate division WOR-3 bacterium]